MVVNQPLEFCALRRLISSQLFKGIRAQKLALGYRNLVKAAFVHPADRLFKPSALLLEAALTNIVFDNFVVIFFFRCPRIEALTLGSGCVRFGGTGNSGSSSVAIDRGGGGSRTCGRYSFGRVRGVIFLWKVRRRFTGRGGPVFGEGEGRSGLYTGFCGDSRFRWLLFVFRRCIYRRLAAWFTAGCFATLRVASFVALGLLLHTRPGAFCRPFGGPFRQRRISTTSTRTCGWRKSALAVTNRSGRGRLPLNCLGRRGWGAATL